MQDYYYPLVLGPLIFGGGSIRSTHVPGERQYSLITHISIISPKGVGWPDVLRGMGLFILI